MLKGKQEKTLLKLLPCLPAVQWRLLEPVRYEAQANGQGTSQIAH
jgi:hypothetical protein